MAETDSFGELTFGVKSSRELQSAFVDLLSGLYHNETNALFLNVRGTFGDDDQQLYSVGLGFRHLFEDPGIIIGGNVYYDHIESEEGNGFNQLGLGAEILTHWVDARFNYYLPEDDRHLVRTFTVNQGNRAVGPQFNNNGFVKQGVRNTNTANTFGVFEQAIEGWNAEVGFLVPGLEKYLELRIFAGCYSYDNPKGGDFSGFKARAEARVTEGITLGVEYWEDAELVGGNWVGEVKVSLPFDIGNLFQGKNPFEGASEVFHRAKPRTLHDRMDEMVIRSHRIQTGNSAPEPMGSTTTTTVTDVTIRQLPPPPPPKAKPTDQGGDGEGGDGEGGGEKPPT